MNGLTFKRSLAACSSAALLCGGALATQAAAQAKTHPAVQPRWHQGSCSGDTAVKGTVTAIPTSAAPDQFTATVSLTHGFFRCGGANPPNGMFGPGKSSHWRGTGTNGGGAGKGSAGGSGTSEQITVSSTTTFAIDGDQSATVADLAVGDHFVATYSGTASEPIGEITSAPALTLTAWAPPQLYGFVGSVVSTDTSSTPETITVDVTKSDPSGFFSGDTTFAVGPRTRIFGIHAGSNGWHGSKAHHRGHQGQGPGGGRQPENPSDISAGDVVAGSEFGFSGETAATVEATPLGVLVDFPAVCSSDYCTYVPDGPYYSQHTLNSRTFRSGALHTAAGLAEHGTGKSHK